MNYEIKLLSDWHVGSGLTAGAESDAEVLKDAKGLPYIPGKTIKGLLKDALNEMPDKQANREIIKKLFGWEIEEASSERHNGQLYFSNATLPREEHGEISKQLAEFLYRNITSTTIDDKGVAKPKTLRTMEMCMPVTLQGEIKCFENGQARIELTQEEKALIEKALKWTRRLGVNRNRGLGRCQFVITKN